MDKLKLFRDLPALPVQPQVHLNRNGEEKLEILYAEKLEVSETGFQNLRSIKAAKVEIKADGNLYDFAIKQDGEIDALGF